VEQGVGATLAIDGDDEALEVDFEGAAIVLCATVVIEVVLVVRLKPTILAGFGLGAWVRPSLPLAADTHVTKRKE
jgi:hypothetical protein